MKKQIVAIAVLVATDAFAEPFTVKGIGSFSCGRYLELRATQDKVRDLEIVSWIYGYMAGFNMEAQMPANQRLPDGPSTLAYVDKHCKENPLDIVLNAATALVLELGGRRNPR